MTRREAIQTEAMLCRITAALSEATPSPRSMRYVTEAREDAESLRRISMTLHRWHELECGNEFGSIERDESTGRPYWFASSYVRMGGTEAPRRRGHLVPDREAGALKRLAAIMVRYPSLSFYVQSDPRGCALYILRPGDVPAGEKAESYYSRGLTVHQ